MLEGLSCESTGSPSRVRDFGVARHRAPPAAMEICCVWWTTKEEALADAAPYTVRSVFKKKRAWMLLTFLPIT